MEIFWRSIIRHSSATSECWKRCYHIYVDSAAHHTRDAFSNAC